MKANVQNEPVELPPEVQEEAPQAREPVYSEPEPGNQQPVEQAAPIPGINETPPAKGLPEEELTRLAEGFETLVTMFQSKIKYDNHKEKIIDQLHQELQEYKNDQAKTMLRPMIMDIIQTIDDIARLVTSHKEKAPGELDPLKLVKQMEGLVLDLTDILFRQGVEPFQCPQPEFNPKRQKIIKTEPCQAQTSDKTVAQRIQPGYEWENRVLRQEKVNVYVFKPASDDTEKEMNSNTKKENES